MPNFNTIYTFYTDWFIKEIRTAIFSWPEYEMQSGNWLDLVDWTRVLVCLSVCQPLGLSVWSAAVLCASHQAYVRFCSVRMNANALYSANCAKTIRALLYAIKEEVLNAFIYMDTHGVIAIYMYICFYMANRKQKPIFAFKVLHILLPRLVLLVMAKTILSRDPSLVVSISTIHSDFFSFSFFLLFSFYSWFHFLAVVECPPWNMIKVRRETTRPFAVALCILICVGDPKKWEETDIWGSKNTVWHSKKIW